MSFQMMLKIEGAWVGVPILCEYMFDSMKEEIPVIPEARYGLTRQKPYTLNSYSSKVGDEQIYASPKKTPVLMSDITLHESYYDYELRTTLSRSTGELHLFLEDYNNFRFGRMGDHKWEALITDDETGQIVLSGLLEFQADSKPILLQGAISSLRPIQFEVRSLLSRMDRDSQIIFTPYSNDRQIAYIWNSDVPEDSIIHILNDTYSLGFQIDYITLPFKSQSFVIDETENILEIVIQLFWEIGYCLRIQSVSTLTCEKINLEKPEGESLERIICHSLIDQSIVKRTVKSLRLEYASVRVKTADALQAEGRALLSYKGSTTLDSKNNRVVTPYGFISPNGYFPAFSEVDESYNELNTKSLGVLYLFDIVTYNFWIDKYQNENKDISLIAAMNLVMKYKAAPNIANEDNPHPADTEVNYFKVRLKSVAFSFHNTLPEDFVPTDVDDGIRNILEIDVYGTAMYRYKKNQIREANPNAFAKFKTEILYFINDHDTVSLAFQRSMRHMNFGNLTFTFQSEYEYPLNKPMEFDDEIGSLLICTLISRVRDTETLLYSYEAITNYDAVPYDEETWSENIEDPNIRVDVYVRNIYSSRGPGAFIATYFSDSTVIKEADDFGRRGGEDVRFFNGIYLLKEDAEFFNKWTVWETELEDGTSVKDEARIELRPSSVISWKILPSQDIEIVQNEGVKMRPKRDSILMEAGTTKDSIYQY